MYCCNKAKYKNIPEDLRRIQDQFCHLVYTRISDWKVQLEPSDGGRNELCEYLRKRFRHPYAASWLNEEIREAMITDWTAWADGLKAYLMMNNVRRLTHRELTDYTLEHPLYGPPRAQ